MLMPEKKLVFNYLIFHADIAVEPNSNSHWKIIISVISSVIVAIAIFLIFYARRRASRKNSDVCDLDKRADEWEVNSGDMTLLERLGDGFFGVVHRAYLYHRPSGSLSKLARKESDLFNNRSEVACKMLKGAWRSCSIVYLYL